MNGKVGDLDETHDARAIGILRQERITVTLDGSFRCLREELKVGASVDDDHVSSSRATNCLR